MTTDPFAPHDALVAYLEGVVGIVEATNAEQFFLWKENDALGPDKMVWRETGHGYGLTLGEIADLPVFVSFMTATIDRHKLLFYHATSRAVDHDIIDKWMETYLPASARFPDGLLNRTDAMNFSNVFRSELDA